MADSSMQKNPLTILAISGSLRSTSSNMKILQVIGKWMPDNIQYIVYDGMDKIPPFNDSEEVPDTVISWRKSIAAADAILICSPEYAFGIPGALKNALDWTVSSGEFVGKPVALITASSMGEIAHAALQHTLGAISAKMIPGAVHLIPFIRAKMNEQGDITEPAAVRTVKNTIEAILQYLRHPNN
jgi:NAD(P)H-dependent FMN reductase